MSIEGERPLECSGCKNPLSISYKEIVGASITCTGMCATCPVYEQKLHGENDEAAINDAGLCCGNCGTSMLSIKRGDPLGCIECYTVFDAILTEELIQTDKIAPRMKSNAQMPLHIGKTPEKTQNIGLSDQLSNMNEALNDALQKENYEQAAWLRDQIKSLMEQTDGTAK